MDEDIVAAYEEEEEDIVHVDDITKLYGEHFVGNNFSTLHFYLDSKLLFCARLVVKTFNSLNFMFRMKFINLRIF